MKTKVKDTMLGESPFFFGPNPICANVLQLLLQPIESQTLHTQLIMSFLSETGRRAPESNSLYVSVAQFP